MKNAPFERSCQATIETPGGAVKVTVICLNKIHTFYYFYGLVGEKYL